jgi:hypothetical protein
MSQLPNLGPCCVCGRSKNVRTIVHLPFKSPIPGRGWGCVLCDLPPDGAVAVVCDRCCKTFIAEVSLNDACKGYPASDGRVPYSSLSGHHAHNMTKHNESE